MTKLAIHDQSQLKSSTDNNNNMLNLTARMQVVIEEITLDVREFLRTLVGLDNNEETREAITNLVDSYMSNLLDCDTFQVICDETNNTPEMVDNGKLALDILFTTEGSQFEGKFRIEPTATFMVPDISHDFFLLFKYKPVPIADPLTLDPVIIGQPVVEYDDMPDALATSLRM